MIPEPRMATRLMERFMLTILRLIFSRVIGYNYRVNFQRSKYKEKTKCYASILNK